MMSKKTLLTASNSPPNHTGMTIKSPDELINMRLAGQVVGKVLKMLSESAQPGMKTRDLDRMAEQEIIRLGALPVFKGYRGFPATICASVNNEIVHGIPGDRIINEGDLVKVDVGAQVNGFIGDAAITIGIPPLDDTAARLIEVTKEALNRGINEARHGSRIGDIGSAIENFVRNNGYAVVREYVGHGVGRALHEEPAIPNYGTPGHGAELREGLVIAIEPMVNIGGWETQVLDDDWTVVTADGSLSAHFQHTIEITDDEPKVLTHP